MIRRLAVLSAACALVFAGVATVTSADAETGSDKAAAPAAQVQLLKGPGPNSDIYHENVGNPQAVGVVCQSGKVVWVQQGQFAWGKCVYNGHGTPVSVTMPANYRAWCNALGAAPGTWRFLVPGGGWVQIWGNDIYKCYVEHY